MSDKCIEAAAEAMRVKRRELQNMPLDRIYFDLARSAIEAYHAEQKRPAEPVNAFKVMAEHFGMPTKC